MSWYLHVHIERVRELDLDEFLGPFDTKLEALGHQYRWGPLSAEAIQVEPLPGEFCNVYSPAEHIDWQKDRIV